MTTIISTPTTVTVSPAGSSALATLVNQMPAGTWAQLTVPNQNAALADTGNSQEMIPYYNSAPWNSLRKRVEIFGRDHGTGGGVSTYAKLVYYVESTNSFQLIRNPVDEFQDSHGYDHNSINPYTGDFYHRMYGGGNGNTPYPVWRKLVDGTAFTQIPNPPSYSTGVALGTAWCNAGFLGSGAQGCLVMFTPGEAYTNPGRILAFDPVSNSWIYNQDNRAPGINGVDNYHQVCEYSAVGDFVVYGGGNRSTTQLWKMDTTGNVTTLAASPVPIGSSPGQGTFTIAPNGKYYVVYDFATWELDPAGTGTWTQRASCPVRGRNPQTAGGPDNVLMVSIPDYNVIALISQPSSTGGAFLIYKPV
jgi:hypothetical protein